jgi:hypothetical protein
VTGGNRLVLGGSHAYFGVVDTVLAMTDVAMTDVEALTALDPVT